MFKEKKEFLILSLLGYAVLLIMAVIFFRERLNIDTSYYFFKSLNKQHFYIEHDRFVLAIAEIPLLIGNYLNISLKTIAIAYSVWHVLFFFLFGFILSWRYKNNTYLLLFLLLQVVGILFGFLCPIFEQYYGTAILAGFYIILRNTKQVNILTGILLFIIAFFAVTSHPFNLILFILLLMLDFTYRKNKRLLLSLLVLVPVYLLFKIFHVSEYEKGKVSWIFDIVNNKTYLKLFESSHWKHHFQFLFQHYREVLAAYILFTLLALWQKLYRQLIIVWVFFIGSVLLINFSYAVTEYSGYIEQVCYLIVPIVFIPFFVDILPGVKHKVILILFLVLSGSCIGYRLYLQYGKAQQYTQKTARVMHWVQDAREKKSCKNYVFFEKYHDISTLIGWDISYASMIYSGFDRGQMQVSIVPLEDNNTKELDEIAPASYLFRYGETEKIQTLNKKYFKLCEDSGYRNLYP